MPPLYRHRYNDSHALVIGVNKYRDAGPLHFAVSDAEAIAKALTDTFGFKSERVRLLLDGDATRDAILDAFLTLAHDGTQEDDRIVFFFAGHGHTERSSKGDVGYLVPADGSPKRLASLIRWDELTRNVDLISAKHILFLMDACYSGLAFRRSIKPGAVRFVKDLLSRTSRQVLAAGKADQTVSDSGGPLAGHSPFTGHLLEALSGKAADANGIMTANGVMAYVYHAVGSELDACQTPQYGPLDGEGDLIFAAPGVLDRDDSQAVVGEDVLTAVPVADLTPQEQDGILLAQTKEYLSDPRHKLQLYELVADETRQTIARTGEDRFPLHDGWNNEAFQKRLAKYEEVVDPLMSMQAILGFWADPVHQSSLVLALKRLADQNKIAGGVSGWLSFRWHPSLLLLYAGGVAAIAGRRYDNLRALFMTETASTTDRHGRPTPLLQAVMIGNQDVVGAFKALPGHEKHYVPRSEYFFTLLQSKLDDTLFLGSDYEDAFDRYEILAALQYAHLSDSEDAWGPPGRFVWKMRRGGSASVYAQLLAECKAQGSQWPPLAAGLFSGSAERFEDIHTRYAQLTTRFGWE